MKARFAAAIAVSVLLAGCVTSGGGEQAQDDSDGPVTLRLQTYAFQGPTVEATKKIIADWNAANPEITVEYVQTSADSVNDQLVTQFQGGTAPDIVHAEAASITAFARQGYLTDLEPLLAQETRDAVPGEVWDTVTVDEEIIAVPTLLQSYVVFANTDLLAAAGVTPPTGADWSWDDLRAAARTATAGDVFGLGWGLRQPTAAMMSLGLNFDGTYFTGEGDDTAIDVNDAALEVPRRVHEMAYTDRSIDPTSLTQSGSDVIKAFLNGRYAMAVGGSFYGQQLKEGAGPDFNWTVLPPLRGTSAEQSANPQTFSVAASSPNQEEAVRFLDYLMQAQNLAALAQGDWLIPATPAARDAVAEATGGADGWDQTLASGDGLIEAPFQKVEDYPQWKDQIATPALQQYFGNQIDLATLRTQLTQGWEQVSGQ